MATEKAFDLDGWNRMMDGFIESLKDVAPFFVAEHRKDMQKLERFLEEQGIKVPRHSDRLAPEKFYPQGEDQAIKDFFARKYPQGGSVPGGESDGNAVGKRKVEVK